MSILIHLYTKNCISMLQKIHLQVSLAIKFELKNMKTKGSKKLV